MKHGLRTLLVAEASITALVGTRVYVETVPQGSQLPHILITQISTDEYNTLDGAGGMRSMDVDIDGKAAGSVSATAVADAVRAYIKNYTGTAGSYTINSVLVNDESAGYEPPTDGSDVGIYYVTLDTSIQFTES